MTTAVRGIMVGVVTGCLLMAGVALAHEKVSGHVHKPARPQVVKISVTRAGFEPATIKVKKGVPIVLLITRKTDRTCAKQAVFSSLGRTVDLPLDQVVRVELPAQAAGHLGYACAMDMFRGDLVIQ